MIVFESIESLKKYLQEDSASKSPNPIRFINVTASTGGQLKKILEESGAIHISLAEYCSGDDTFPNLRRLRQDLKSLPYSVFVTGLADFFRLTPKRANKEITLFLNLYPPGTYSFRVFFLMTRLQTFISTICEPCSSHCFLLLNELPDYSLTIIQNPLKLRMENEKVTGIKEYLCRSETEPPGDLILYTDNARHLRNENFSGDTEVVDDAFDFLRRHYNLPRRLKKRFGSETYWQKLATQVSNAGSLEKNFLQNFKVTSYSLNVFNDFGALDKFKQWLIWLHVQEQSVEYAVLCAQKSCSPTEFINRVYELIFSLTTNANFETLCEQRKKMLSLMKCATPPSFFQRIRQTKKEIALKILTDSTHAERLLIFETLQKFTVDEYDLVLPILQKNFPLLAKYLSGASEDRHSEYFKWYRWLKVTDSLSEEFITQVKDRAHNSGKNLYAFETRNQIVTAEYSDDSVIFFIDGLGAEYLNFFKNQWRTADEKVSVRYRIGRCNLPTVTEANKDFLDGRRVSIQERALDMLKHETRAYPENILNELDYLVGIQDKIRLELNFHNRIIVCSDHGSSRLAVLVRNSRFDKVFPSEGRRIYKHGRFAEFSSTAENKIPATLECDDKIIFADYSRFVQKGAPGNEIHGGASFEEALVPIIIFERAPPD